MEERRGEAFAGPEHLTVMGRHLHPGDPAPDFRLDYLDLADLAIRTVSLADSAGMVRLLNVVNSLARNRPTTWFAHTVSNGCNKICSWLRQEDGQKFSFFFKEASMVQQHARIRLNPAEETIQVGVLQIRFLVTGAVSNGSAAIFELTIPAGAGLPAPPHSHDAYEETVYGLEGVSTWTVDGVGIEVRPGQALCIPRGAVHAFANYHTVDAKALLTLSPAAIGPAYFREVAALIKVAAGGPPDKAKMVEILRRYGLTPAPPPSA